MSSTYRLICLSHDPALVIENPEWSSRDAIEAFMTPDGDSKPSVAEHSACDLLIGRFSYPLIEVGCPPKRGCPATHNHVRWADADWLRLLLVANESQSSQLLMTAIKPLERRCWTYHRLSRIRAELWMDASVPEPPAMPDDRRIYSHGASYYACGSCKNEWHPWGTPCPKEASR